MSKIIIEPLQNLNSLKRGELKGIYKQWIYLDNCHYQVSCDYLEKVKFSIEDLNSTFEKDDFSYKDIVFVICLVDWIRESVNCIKKAFKMDILEEFAFSSNEIISDAKDYFVAMRSFIVAHPLETNRHNKFSLDGNYICVDLVPNDSMIIKLTSGHEEAFRYMDYKGMHNGETNSDFYLKTYASDFYSNKFFVHIGFRLEDIVKYARLCIQEIYEMDRYLSTLKLKDFQEGV